MDTPIAIGFSNKLNSVQAAQEAAINAQNQIGDLPITLAIVFSTIHYDPHQTLPAINQILNTQKTIGCSTAGVILSDDIHTRGIGILLFASPQMNIGISAVDRISSQDRTAVGHFLAQQALSQFGGGARSVFLLFVDGNSGGSSILLKGLQEVLGNVFPIVGAGSCDDFHFQENFQFFQNYVLKDSAVGVILGGHVSIGVGGRHGWRPLGKPRVIDNVDGNIIKSINGKKATSIYEEFFGDDVESLYSTQLGRTAIIYPLGIYIEESPEYLLRNAVSILPDGSILCQGDVPLGAQVHLMIGNKDSCLLSAKEAAQEAQRNLFGRPAKLVIMIESLARLKLLGRNAFDEIKEIKKVFGPDIPIFGMYAFGEICPFQSVDEIKKPYLQNESVVVLGVG
jgi:hypothetical protein